MPKIKKIKAWAVVRNGKIACDHFGMYVFEEEKSVAKIECSMWNDYRKTGTKKYQVVPCEITLKIPNKKK